jgi:hypothetical protein
VAPGVVILLEQRQVMMPVQKVGGAEPGDAGADDGEGGPEERY